MSEVLQLVGQGKTIWAELVELQPQSALCTNYTHPDHAEAVSVYKDHHRFVQT